MSNENPIVTIEDGKLKGSTEIDWLGKKYYSFKGIPFAKPPIGDLRFKAPQPVESWEGVKDATKEGSGCYCRELLTQQTGGSEDCLYLNVCTPELPSNHYQPKAVMVSIHGGGFMWGSGSLDIAGPDFLISEDIVFVTFNYRVGLLGFASFSDATLEIPGNAGLKDQVMALKWVQKNISKFGGNPENVTVFGVSAGGASVHFLMLSPLAKGLFHRAIAQSGVSTSGWARGHNTAALLAKALGIEEGNEKEVVKVLKDIPLKKLIEIHENLAEGASLSLRPSCGPVVESFDNESAFLTQDPTDIIRSGNYSHVPLMIGYTSREGMMFGMLSKELKSITNYENVIPLYLSIKDGTALSKQVAEKIKQYYYGSECPSFENVDQYYLVYTDAYFFIDINNVVREHTKTASCPIFYYRVSIETRLNMGKTIASIKEPGTSHGDDVGYLYKTIWTPKIRPNSPEEIGIKRFIKLWTTFAKYGDPNPVENDVLINLTWPPTENDSLHYLDIGENLTVGVNPEPQRVKFWDDLFDMCTSKTVI